MTLDYCIAVSIFLSRLKLHQRFNQLATDDKAIHSRLRQQLTLPISMRRFSIRSTQTLSPICYLSSLIISLSSDSLSNFWKTHLNEPILNKFLLNQVSSCIQSITPLLSNETIISQLLPRSPNAENILKFAKINPNETHTVNHSLQKTIN